MAIRLACPETGAVASAKQRLAAIIAQHHLARHHDDKLVLRLVPVTQRGAPAWRQDGAVDAELCQPGRVADALALISLGFAVERLGINEAADHLDIGKIDLRHGGPPVPVDATPASGLHDESSANSRSGHRRHTENPAFPCGLARRMPASGPAGEIPQRGS